MENQVLFARLREILETDFSKDRDSIFKQLDELSQIRYKLSEARANAQKLLYERRYRALPSKDKSLNELDRRTIMEADANLQQIQRDSTFLESLEAIVSDRMALGIAYLSDDAS